MENNYTKFENFLPDDLKGILIYNEEMKNHTTFKIGGCADLFIEPRNIFDLQVIIKAINESKVNYYIIGNGSNLLISDKGFRGIIIKIGSKMSKIRIDENRVHVQAGALLSLASKEAAKAGLCGMEFASGIPGYIGGAIAMNAGAYNGEIKDIVESVECISMKGEITTYSSEDMKFSYRVSKASLENLIVCSAVFRLESGSYEEAMKKIEELAVKRKQSQPLEMPSAGSAFKRPNIGYASRLIEDVGLKGYEHGGVMVSSKHSGFIINHNNGSCQDVLELMNIIIEKVYDKFQIKLEPEVKIIGEF